MKFSQFKKKPIVKFITNKYIIFALFFIVWMFFFDENSFLNHLEFDKEINKLNAEKEYYQKEINQDKELIEKLKNKEELEKFAREEYHMKKENEEIYLIEYDTLEKK
ncbi:MAG: septum formation initiator family protein [Lutibacter sp.]|uniref:FtsB family cell division protein n=1 Tax=Lutibacter sp. TaxID=1925666 RepID=UPI0017D49C56|nr:septum formation initiator family protein [Lutibacter sp.]MBT8318429.1 septum formation initiator family protein [Lutibacter sp.]NNJ59287.1 septum formation initiator family protein [Lutibacter sp.]